MDVDRYVARIGWTGALEVNPATLAGLLAHHMEAIPFENLDVLLGRPPQLDLDALEDKLVVQRRGGYCYEHSTLFAAVLREIGFEVSLHSARVVAVTPRQSAPRTHMFLSVGDQMLDPGFGGLAPRVPVPRDGSSAGPHRLVQGEGEWVLEHAGKSLWISTFERDLPIDFEMANHFTATHPSSPFTRMLLMRAYIPGGQIKIANRDVTIIRGAETQTFSLTDRAQLRALVAEHFGFDLPAIESLQVAQVPDWT